MSEKELPRLFAHILKEIRNECEVIQTGLPNPPTVWISHGGKQLRFPADFVAFLRQANGLRRVKDDQYFTFRIYPLTEFDDYFSYQRLTEDEDLQPEMHPELRPGELPSNHLLFGGEGEFGVFLLNCGKDSPYFGRVSCVVANIPECAAEWESFTTFIEGLAEYCREFPLGKYKEELPGSTPLYGYAVKPRTIDPSG
jgi:hypothetical protein